MSNTRSFTDFDSPDSGTALSTKEAGVLLTDTLEDFREKTNGIIEKVKSIDATIDAAGGAEGAESSLSSTITGNKIATHNSGTVGATDVDINETITTLLEKTGTSSDTSKTTWIYTNEAGVLREFDVLTSSGVKDSVQTFGKFTDYQDRGYTSFYRCTTYINKSGKFCAVGTGPDDKLSMAGFTGSGEGGGKRHGAFNNCEIMVPMDDGDSIITSVSANRKKCSMHLLSAKGKVYAVGGNNGGKLGLGDTEDRYFFEQISSTATGSGWWGEIAWLSPNSGVLDNFAHMGAVSRGVGGSGGGGAEGDLYMWGRNKDGQLGINNLTDQNIPVKVNTAAFLASGRKVEKVFTHTGKGWETGEKGSTWLIDDDRNVYSCGSGDGGRLGSGSTSDSSTFAQVFLAAGPAMKADDIILDNYKHGGTVFIIDRGPLGTGGDLYACGNNKDGRLGIGNSTNQNYFQKVNQAGTDVAAATISNVGDGFVLCMTQGGGVKVWGDNPSGNFGLGYLQQDKNTPQTLLADSSTNPVVKAITFGDNPSTVILKADGTIWTCGYNGKGALALGHHHNARPGSVEHISNNHLVLTLTKIVMDNNLKFKDISGFGELNASWLIAIDQDDNMWASGWNDDWNIGSQKGDIGYVSILRKLNIS
jgi:alpha-tubulin suppressor-like RCC1 family protein